MSKQKIRCKQKNRANTRNEERTYAPEHAGVHRARRIGARALRARQLLGQRGALRRTRNARLARSALRRAHDGAKRLDFNFDVSFGLRARRVAPRRGVACRGALELVNPGQEDRALRGAARRARRGARLRAQQRGAHFLALLHQRDRRRVGERCAVVPQITAVVAFQGRCADERDEEGDASQM